MPERLPDVLGFEGEGATLEDRLIIFGALAFLLGTAGAALLYAKDPYSLTPALFLIPPAAAWPFYLGASGIISLSLGGAIAYVRHR